MFQFQIRLRHVLDTKSLVEINTSLTDLQRIRLQQTPFKWIVDLKEQIKISGVLLRELVSRWVEPSGGFRVKSRVVPFTTLDVCVALGLPIVGQPVSLDDNEYCHVKSLFNGESVTIERIIQMLTILNNDHDIEDFCRIYILLTFAVFYFPRTTATVSSIPFKLLDNLDSLHMYNWGFAVYEYLAGSLSHAATHYNEARNSAQMHIAGCTALLQVLLFYIALSGVCL